MPAAAGAAVLVDALAGAGLSAESFASALMARRTSSLVRLAASGSAGRRARETRVLTAERVERLRSRLRMEARTRFFADWVLAMRAVIRAEWGRGNEAIMAPDV